MLVCGSGKSEKWSAYQRHGGRVSYILDGQVAQRSGGMGTLFWETQDCTTSCPNNLISHRRAPGQRPIPHRQGSGIDFSHPRCTHIGTMRREYQGGTPDGG